MSDIYTTALNDDFMRRLEDVIRGSVLQEYKKMPDDLAGIDDEDTHCNDMIRRATTRRQYNLAGALSAKQFESALEKIFSENNNQLGGLGKNVLKKLHQKYQPKIVHKKYNPKILAKKIGPKSIHKNYGPQVVHKRAKLIAKKINTKIKRIAKNIAPAVRKVALIVAAAIVIYYTGGAAAPIIAKMMQERERAKMESKAAKRLLQQQIEEEKLMLENDPEYRAKVKAELDSDPEIQMMMVDAQAQARKKQALLPLLATAGGAAFALLS